MYLSTLCYHGNAHVCTCVQYSAVRTVSTEVAYLCRTDVHITLLPNVHNRSIECLNIMSIISMAFHTVHLCYRTRDLEVASYS